MQAQTEMRLRLIQSERARQIQSAFDAALLADARSGISRHAMRRAVGHRLMRLGARLAAEPTYRPARAR